MKNAKKFLGVFCAVCMVLATAVSASAAEYSVPADEVIIADSVESPEGARIVGVKFTATSEWNLIDLEVGPEVNRVKIWVYSETGSMDVKIVDENGDSIKTQQTLIAGSDDPSFVYYFNRDASYTGTYYLKVRGTDSYTASGWYHWIED